MYIREYRFRIYNMKIYFDKIIGFKKKKEIILDI